jgi:hypothetical protein
MSEKDLIFLSTSPNAAGTVEGSGVQSEENGGSDYGKHHKR